MATLNVQGFTGHLIALNGQYTQHGENHGKPTYKKRAEMDGTTQAHVYYWDERDGDSLSGWWMAPEVGGEQVWAQCINKGMTPPTRGWKVPWHSATPDNRVYMELKAPGQQYGQKRPNPMGGQQQQQGPNKFQRFNQQHPAQMPGQGGLSGMKKVGQADLTQVNAKRQKLEKATASINGSLTGAEKIIKNLASAKDDSEKAKFLSQAKASLSNVTRQIDTFIKQGQVEEHNIVQQRNKINQMNTDITNSEKVVAAARKKKLEEIKSSYVTELTVAVADVESLVEKTKDAAVLFTCEMAEHIKPEEAIEAKAKTDKEAAVAQEAVKKAKDMMNQKDKELRGHPQSETQPIRDAIKPVIVRLQAAEKDLNTVRTQAVNAWKKAQAVIQQKKREEEAENQKAEKERVAAWNKEALGLAFQIGLIADELLKGCDGAEDETPLKECEGKFLGLKVDLETRLKAKECQNQSRGNLTATVKNLDGKLSKVRQLRKTQKNKDDDKIRVAQVVVACAAREKMGDKTDAAFFSEVTGNTNKMDAAKFEKFVKTIEADIDCVNLLYKDACRYAGAEPLTIEGFRLNILNAYYFTSKPLPVSETVELKSKNVGMVDVSQVVNVIEGPTEVENNTIRVKVSCHKKGSPDIIEGFITMRVGPAENVRRFSPNYTVLKETVLTDTFELKGFKVIRRIKPEEKFHAIGIPLFNAESDMWRINGYTEEKEAVWVTITGNRGSQLLKNVPFGATVKEDPPIVEEMNQDKLSEMLASMADSESLRLSSLMDACEGAKDVCVQKVQELEIMDGEGKEPSKEEVDAQIKDVETMFGKQRDASGKAHASISKLQGQLKNVEAGPLADMKVAFPTFLEKIAEHNTEIKTLGEKRRKLQTSITQKESARRIAREKAEAEAQAASLLAEIPPKTTEVEGLAKQLTNLDEQGVPKMTDSITICQTFMVATSDLVRNVKEAAIELRGWMDEKMPPQQKQGSPLIVPLVQLKKHKQTLTQLAHKCDTWNAKLAQLKVQFKEKVRVEFAVLMKNYMTKNELDGSKIFKEIAGEKEMISREEFGVFAKKVCSELNQVDDLLDAALGTATELTADHMDILSRATYKCLKRALITDIVDIKSCKRLRAVEPEETVSVSEKHVMCENTQLTRFKGKLQDGTEGYLTIKGNKSSTYFKFQQPFWKVIKETVLTDRFEMANFSVKRRLKEGDFVRELSTPELESEKSKLWRMKVQTLDDNVIAWVTVKGNQGSVFLMNTELPRSLAVPATAPATEETKEKEEAKKEA